MKQKIAVAMSGGVDSSVVAALLKQQGYDVTDLHLICWNAPGCPAEQDKEDARRVAGKLDIPFYVIDAVEEYRSFIIDEMVKEYSVGRTPNPDVWCNERIKFGFLLDKARVLGFDMIATGHYARVTHENNSRLYRGVDSSKDQSYFLWRLNQDQLSSALFPIGDTYKKDVRKKADEFGLSTARKKDSQGLCFVGQFNMRAFLKDKISMEPGIVKLTSGKEVGRHDGLLQYTIGQRASIGGPGPFYVVALDQPNNTLIVTDKPEDPQLYTTTTTLTNVRWISGRTPPLPFKCHVDVRYHALPVKAELQKDGTTLIFQQPVRAVTPGQSVIMYVGDELIGGGIVSSY